MALSLASISKEVKIRAPRMVLLGTEKIGKTSFACGTLFDKQGNVLKAGINNPIVISMKGEDGADALDVAQFPAVTTYNEVIEALSVLYHDDHAYQTVVIDSVSALEPLVWDEVCRLNNCDSIEKACGGYGKGYLEAVALFRKLFDWLDALRDKGMASILIGHVKVKRFDDPNGESYDQYQFDVNDKVANLSFRWADLILFANTKVTVKTEKTGFKEKKRGIDITGGNRFLFTQKQPSHPGGGRGFYGRLPYELPLDYTTFEAAVSALLQAK